MVSTPEGDAHPLDAAALSYTEDGGLSRGVQLLLAFGALLFTGTLAGLVGVAVSGAEVGSEAGAETSSSQVPASLPFVEVPEANHDVLEAEPGIVPTTAVPVTDRDPVPGPNLDGPPPEQDDDSRAASSQPPEQAPFVINFDENVRFPKIDLSLILPQRVGYIRAGKIYLEGPVGSEADMAQVVSLAGQILGPDNVINNYYVDDRAPGLDVRDSGKIIVEDAVLFATGSANIEPAFEPLLGQGAALMAIRPNAEMTIVGHTDAEGSDTANLRLSQERADAVVQYLVDRGVDPERMTGDGRGESEPRADNETAVGREANRRIEVLLYGLFSE